MEGIHKDTFYDWLHRGERGWETDIKGGYVEFSDAVKKAVAIVETLTVADLRKGPQNWQSKAWWLERRHPDRWGNRQKMPVRDLKNYSALADRVLARPAVRKVMADEGITME